MGPGIIRLPRVWACGVRRLRIAAFVTLAALVLFPTHVFAQQLQQGGSATARSQVAVLTPGSIAKIQDMDFGNIAQSNTAGTIVLTAGATATCTASGTLIRSGACKAAGFSIYGRKNNRVFLRENNGGQITLNGPGGATMLLNNLTIAVVGMTSKVGATGWDFGSWKVITNNGIAEFYVGGTLNIPSAQPPGVYNGTLMIQVQFN
jgi:hypothetical protein